MDVTGSIEDLQRALFKHGYLADRRLATSISLALGLSRPLLLEGEAGVGKTELAKALAGVMNRELIRLQCYDGIDAAQALYEWDYTRQILYTRALSRSELDSDEVVADLFGPRFLLERPLLKAMRLGSKCVLLVDELDRADAEFEAFLLEVLSDFQVTIPEIGTIKADRPPAVVLTSNRTRDLNDALKRRCHYHWIDFPSALEEATIVEIQVPDVPDELSRKVAAAASELEGDEPALMTKE